MFFAKIPPLKLFHNIIFPNGYSKEPPNLDLDLISGLFIKSSVGSLVKDKLLETGSQPSVHSEQTTNGVF